jgi:hypothetical protein
MLAYFDTSGHDDQTMREVHGREPSAEFAAWAVSRGILWRDAFGKLRRGPHWGDPTIFVSETELAQQREVTPLLASFALLEAQAASRAPVGDDVNAGPRPAEAVARMMRLQQVRDRISMICVLCSWAGSAAQAFSRRAVHTALQLDLLMRVSPMRLLEVFSWSSAVAASLRGIRQQLPTMHITLETCKLALRYRSRAASTWSQSPITGCRYVRNQD